MDDGDRNAVEFLDATAVDGVDEVLAPPPRGDGWRRWFVLLGPLLVVVAGGAVARLANGSAPAATGGSSSAAPTAITHPVPAPWPGGADILEATPGATVALPGDMLPVCRRPDCVVWLSVPAATVRALLGAFPQAVIRVAYSVMSATDRTLQVRQVQAQSGAAGVVVDVVAAAGIDHASVRGQVDEHLVRAVARVPGYLVTVTVSDSDVSLSRVMGLAQDPALLALR